MTCGISKFQSQIATWHGQQCNFDIRLQWVQYKKLGRSFSFILKHLSYRPPLIHMMISLRVLLQVLKFFWVCYKLTFRCTNKKLDFSGTPVLKKIECKDCCFFLRNSFWQFLSRLINTILGLHRWILMKICEVMRNWVISKIVKLLSWNVRQNWKFEQVCAQVLVFCHGRPETLRQLGVKVAYAMNFH